MRAGRSVYRIPLAALLIVDEIGDLPVSPGGTNLFFQLVSVRDEKGAMIVTSNRGFVEWGEVFDDPVVATALLDRLRRHTDLVPENVPTSDEILPPVPRRRGRPKTKGEGIRTPGRSPDRPGSGEFCVSTSGEL